MVFSSGVDDQWKWHLVTSKWIDPARASQAVSIRQTARTSARIYLRVCSVQGVHTFCCSCFWRTLWTTKKSCLRCWTERSHQVYPYRWVSCHIKKLIPCIIDPVSKALHHLDRSSCIVEFGLISSSLLSRQGWFSGWNFPTFLKFLPFVLS